MFISSIHTYHFFCCCYLTVWTALTAASSKLSATTIFSFLYSLLKSYNNLFPYLALVPVNLQTNGTLKSTNLAAWIIPFAITSHFIIPPKILIKIVLTFGWEFNISNAVLTCYTLAPPPTSKKFAGYPPFNWMISIVAIANPAPLTIHPILPSKAT